MGHLSENQGHAQVIKSKWVDSKPKFKPKGKKKKRGQKPGCHNEEGVVHPRGWGCVPVAMCLISLSRLLDLARSWCITSFVNIVGSYSVSPSLSCCDELIFPFEISFCQIQYFYGFESTWYISCIWILVVTMGYHVHSLDMCFGI